MRVLIILFVLFLVGYTACVLIFRSVHPEVSWSRLGQEPFSVEVWAQAAPFERSQMVHSLLSQHSELLGQKNEVKNMLGPSTTYYMNEYHLAYDLGVEPGTNRERILIF